MRRLAKAQGWRDELGAGALVEIAYHRAAAQRAWEADVPDDLPRDPAEPAAPGLFATLADVDFDQEAVLVVAEEVHFGRAAARLHLAQSAVSQHVAHLEREVGVALLERTSRRVDLTRAGEALLGEARRTLDAAGSARRAARRAAAGETGWLRIGFVDSAAYDLLPRLLVAFHHHRPEVRLEL